MRQFPDGFPHYRDKGDTLSAAVNAYFSDHGLRETDSHTLYSLRHGFKDKLRSVETPDELKDELMGHDTKNPKYGDGHGVDLKWKYIQLSPRSAAAGGGSKLSRSYVNARPRRLEPDAPSLSGRRPNCCKAGSRPLGRGDRAHPGCTSEAEVYVSADQQPPNGESKCNE
ncbi:MULTISPECIES: hypothetical protein [Bradyrhizobium]|uniref:hypothetical protein n=1 Tax=Bradyrhizobium TaxID=374 RepID=UPI001872DED8|nr:hypothetical protein [Bradyrhizobium elkanii]MBP2433965.1 hypothetical protein [Bradyrhizobium elkanii]WLA85730.1 hypothetical protein QNJ99_16800 [Bradyrhizobium elkanii]WLA89075.1 hypothetical protein QNJ96_28870 [Bradyrhizobium elkanii]